VNLGHAVFQKTEPETLHLLTLFLKDLAQPLNTKIAHKNFVGAEYGPDTNQ
jgi:hypothetical protein